MKRSEYETRARAFRAMLNTEGQKPQTEQVWPDMADWLTVEGTSTCTTPTCAVFNQPSLVTLHENADGVHRGQCGRCGQLITPVPVLEEG